MTPERPHLQIRSHLQRYQGSGLHLFGGRGDATELMTRFRAVVSVCFCVCGPWHRAWRYITACRGVVGANTRADGVRMSSLSSVVDLGSSGDRSHPSTNGSPGRADLRGRPLPGSTVDVSRCLSTFLPQQSQLSEEVKQSLLSLAFEILLTVSLSSKKKRKKKPPFLWWRFHQESLGAGGEAGLVPQNWFLQAVGAGSAGLGTAVAEDSLCVIRLAWASGLRGIPHPGGKRE